MPANYVLLERIELNASASSITFANIPQTGYTDLKIVVSGRTSTAAVQGYITAAFNGSTANFTIRGLGGTGSGAASWTTPSNFVGEIVGDTATASTFSNLEMYIPNYAGSTNKSYSVDGVAENNATFAQSAITAGLWSQTAAITSVAFTPNSGSFLANSTFSLYGLAALGTTPVIAPKASGGNRIDYDGTYWIHTFNTSGTFTPQTALSCDYLVVAGGGAGGGQSQFANGGAGGGAGGYRTATAFSVSSAATVTIGAGGAGASGARGSSGTDSVFSTITSTGGGRGGIEGSAGSTGGSGGAASGVGAATVVTGYAGNTPSTSPSQGNNGGNGYGEWAGGGGGASANGANASANVAGNGGNGTANSISGSSVTYAGGGGGGRYNTGTFGSGGTGGGGSATSGNGGAGTANTGGGGAGSSDSTTTARTGGNGGSGIVIIRYPAA
jgi:hypothetical protein